MQELFKVTGMNLVRKSLHSEALCLLGTADKLYQLDQNPVCASYVSSEINPDLRQCKLQLSRLLYAPTRQQQSEKRKYFKHNKDGVWGNLAFGGIWKVGAVGWVIGLLGVFVVVDI